MKLVMPLSAQASERLLAAVVKELCVWHPSGVLAELHLVHCAFAPTEYLDRFNEDVSLPLWLFGVFSSGMYPYVAYYSTAGPLNADYRHPPVSLGGAARNMLRLLYERSRCNASGCFNEDAEAEQSRR